MPWTKRKGKAEVFSWIGLGRFFLGGGVDYSAEEDGLLLIDRMFRFMLTKIHSQIQKFILVETELPKLDGHSFMQPKFGVKYY